MTKTLVTALVIDPTRMVLGLWKRRELIGQFTRRNIELRHRGSRSIRDQQRKVEPLIGFDAGTDTGGAKSLWRGHAAGGHFNHVGHRKSHTQWRTAATSTPRLSTGWRH